MTEQTIEMRDAFGRMLVELGEENTDIFVLDADLNTSTRTVYFKERFPRRFLQMGIAEQNMFGVAAGLSTTGIIPFPTTFAVFAARRAADQISISIAYPKLNVKIPGTYPGLPTGKAGATHQSVQDMAIMRAMPHMRVVDPGDNVELCQVMRAATEYVGPVYFRVTRPAVPDIPWPEGYAFSWGRGVNLRTGSDVALVSTGFMTSHCLRAAGILEGEGISARVDHHPCLKPLDSALIEEAAGACGAVVTVENHSVLGGLGGAVAETVAERCPIPMRRIGIHDQYVETGEIADLFVKYGMRVEDIVTAAQDAVAFKHACQTMDT
jgi:transketolase